MAYCGLMCEGCPIYWATRERNKEKKEKMIAAIVRICNEQNGLQYTSEDIEDCDGCRTESGNLFSGCRDCRIRVCATEKGIESCASCSEYACENLQTIFITEPGAQTRLEVMRSIL